jgi:GDP-4-dehydro-6-deoxy-D-mannose reductase
VTDVRVLVTGATGFVGTWVLRHWRQVYPDAEIWATSDRAGESGVTVSQYRQIDLRNAEAVRSLVADCRPQRVVHLGGLIGNASLELHLSVNVLGSENLYQALADLADLQHLRVVQIGSAASYGLVRPDELPVKEEQLPRPVTAYGISKLAQDHLAVAMGHSTGLAIVRACVFNILGPGQSANLVPMAFLRQMADARPRSAVQLRVGNTSPRRDFLDVRDVAEGLEAVLMHGLPGEAYNIASGREYSVQELITMAACIAGMQVELEVDASRLRPVDVPCVRASLDKVAAATGWQPRRSLEQSLRDMWQECATAAPCPWR